MAKTKESTKLELRKRLARDLHSILTNPEAPAMLYNDLADAVTELSNDLGNDYWHSPEVLEQSITAHMAKEEKRKGGAR